MKAVGGWAAGGDGSVLMPAQGRLVVQLRDLESVEHWRWGRASDGLAHPTVSAGCVAIPEGRGRAEGRGARRQVPAYDQKWLLQSLKWMRLRAGEACGSMMNCMVAVKGCPNLEGARPPRWEKQLAA